MEASNRFFCAYIVNIYLHSDMGIHPIGLYPDPSHTLSFSLDIIYYPHMQWVQFVDILIWTMCVLSDTLGAQLSEAWEREVEKKSKKKKTPSLLKASMSVFGWRLAGLGLVLFILEIGFR